MLYCCCLVIKLCPTLLQHWLPESLPVPFPSAVYENSLFLISTGIRCYSSMFYESEYKMTSHKYFNLYSPTAKEFEHLFMCSGLLFCELYIHVLGGFSLGLFILVLLFKIFSFSVFILFLSICKIFLYSTEVKLLSFVLQILIHIYCLLSLFIYLCHKKGFYILSSKSIHLWSYNL